MSVSVSHIFPVKPTRPPDVRQPLTRLCTYGLATGHCQQAYVAIGKEDVHAKHGVRPPNSDIGTVVPLGHGVGQVNFELIDITSAARQAFDSYSNLLFTFRMRHRPSRGEMYIGHSVCVSDALPITQVTQLTV